MAKLATTPEPARRQPVTTVCIDSLEAADAALREMGELLGQLAQVQADEARDVAEIRGRYVERLSVRIGGEKVSIADRLCDLRQAVGEWAETNKALLLADQPGKSRPLTHGVLGWRSSRAKLQELPAADAAAKSNVLTRALERLCKMFGKFAAFRKLPLPTLCRLKIEADKPAISKALASQLLQPADLVELGLTLVPGADELYLEPHPATVVSHESQSIAGRPLS